jgi:hypothetical protein
MAVYGPVRHQKNIWTEASEVHMIFLLVTNRSIYCHMSHDPHWPQCHELFAIHVLYFLSKMIMQVPGRSIY